MRCHFCEEKAVWEVRAQMVNLEEEGSSFELTLTVCGRHKEVAADEIFVEIIEALGGISSGPDPVSIKAYPLIQ